MTLTDLIPSLRGTGSRRAIDEVERLRADNTTLLNRQIAADEYFAILTHDRDQVYVMWKDEKQQREQAEAALTEVQAEQEALAAEVEYLRAQLAPFLAAEANANSIDVPPMVRDTTDGADQATDPIGINVSALWEAAEAGHLGPVTDPGHTTT